MRERGGSFVTETDSWWHASSNSKQQEHKETSSFVCFSFVRRQWDAFRRRRSFIWQMFPPPLSERCSERRCLVSRHVQRRCVRRQQRGGAEKPLKVNHAAVKLKNEAEQTKGKLHGGGSGAAKCWLGSKRRTAQQTTNKPTNLTNWDERDGGNGIIVFHLEELQIVQIRLQPANRSVKTQLTNKLLTWYLPGDTRGNKCSK